jgi:hypothetical protein
MPAAAGTAVDVRRGPEGVREERQRCISFLCILNQIIRDPNRLLTDFVIGHHKGYWLLKPLCTV